MKTYNKERKCEKKMYKYPGKQYLKGAETKVDKRKYPTYNSNCRIGLDVREPTN